MKNKKESAFLYIAGLFLLLISIPGISNAAEEPGLSVGSTHTLAIKADGTLWAWGENDEGQIGDGTAGVEGDFRNIPVKVGISSDWKTVAAGSHHSLAIKHDGSLWTWGGNYYGQLGNDATLPGAHSSVPTRIGSDTDWQSLSATGHHSLALKSDGTLWAWGYNQYGQLGDETKDSTSTPKKIGLDGEWLSASAGDSHSIAIKANGTLWTWGSNRDGALGDGTTNDSSVPIQIGTETNWQNPGAGYAFSAAIKSDGTLWAWGNSDEGQIGDGTVGQDEFKSTPTQVAGNDWARVSPGGLHTTASKADGSIWAWGRNSSGQLGDGTTINRPTPVMVSSNTNWYIIDAGRHDTAAINTQGELSTWGSNYYGKLGNGTNVESYGRVQAGEDTDWAGLASNGNHNIAIKTNDSLWIWGRDEAGGDPGSTPIPLGSDSDWKQFSSGGYHTLAIKDDDTLWTWGDNFKGQLGNGTNEPRKYPAQLESDTWQAIAGGSAHTLAIKSDGTLWTWGSNRYGQLGDNSIIDSSVPVQVGTDTDWESVFAGAETSFAIKESGALWAWGDNRNRQLGVDSTDDSKIVPTVVIVTGVSVSWQTVAPGFNHTLGLTTSGALYAWGANYYGQLGLGTLDYFDRSMPVRVGTENTWQHIAASDSHSLAVKANTLWVWGDNEYGQLGAEGKYVPTQIGTETNWKTVSTGERHSAALKLDGTIWAWGSNNYGQLGDGSAWSTDPAVVLTGVMTIYPRFITPSSITNGTIFPATEVRVSYSTTAEFTLSPDEYFQPESVSGTCPLGTFLENSDTTWTYTTGLITFDCTVVAAFHAAPVITEGPDTRVTMDEDASPRLFNLTLAASDADTDTNTLIWSISSNGTIGTASVSGTGTPKTIDYTPDPDQNGDDSFDVQVSDGVLTDTITVNVTIEAINDPPVFTDSTLAFTHDEVLVGQITVTDVDDDLATITFQLVGGVDQDLFDLTADGQLSFKIAPDMQNPTDFDGDNIYEIDIQIFDGDDTTEQSITVVPGGCTFFVIPAGNSKTAVICL